ncbi:MAG: RHS repeat-associated core domain-containing protein, partial [Pyrinomonadaceae bacterium]
QKFTGYERDIEVDLDFAQARYYNSNHGRFTTTDPAMLSMNGNNPQTFNRYAYVMNNPLLYTDPLGLWALEFRAVYKKKDGKETTEIDHYILVAVRTKGDRDTPEELARQLGLKGKEVKKFVEEFNEKLAKGKISADAVQISKLGGDVGRVYGIVEELYTAQKKYEAKNGSKGGPYNFMYADCSSTAANLNSPFVEANENNWSVEAMDEYIRNNLKSIPKEDLRVGDVIRYALDEGGRKNVPRHFTTFLFMSDDGVPMVFSRNGKGGPFEYGKASDFVRENYGTIRGIGKDPTGYYGRR